MCATPPSSSTKYCRPIRILLRLLFTIAGTSASFAKSPDSAPPQPKPSFEAYGQQPLVFEANRGQSDESVRFISRGSRSDLFLTSREAVFTLRKPVTESEGAAERATLATESKQTREAVLRFKLTGANATPEMSGVAELPGKVHYFLGNDPAKWRTNVPTYSKVRYRDVYPGVDMVYYGNQGQLEYDLIVAPGASPDVITLGIEGSKELRLNPQGDLELEVEDGIMVMRKPEVYQEINGVRRVITGSYILQGRDQLSFQIGDYDTTRPLVLDPVLVYSTYLGGSKSDRPWGIAADSSGNAYVVGQTNSINFPTKSPWQPAYGGYPLDVVVTKYNAAGVVIYSTYLGGNDYDYGLAIATDGAGNAYVTGCTSSTNFPTFGGPVVSPLNATFGGANGDAFVAKLNQTGTIVYSTYLGGSMEDAGIGIAVKTGNAYVTGHTDSKNFPVAGGAKVSPLQLSLGGVRDIFVAKFNVAGNALVYSTLIGGSGQGLETGNAIAVDGSGNAYVTGYIEDQAGNFPTVRAYDATPNGGGMDAFVLKLNAAGNKLLYSTYLGGSLNEVGWGIAVDFFGYAYVTGETRSSDFPTKNALKATMTGSGDAFVAKIDATATGPASLLYSTYFGGSGGDGAQGIAADSAGSACITGSTTSSNLTLLNPIQTVLKGSQDAFIAMLNSSGSALLFSTYFGGIAGYDEAFGVALDDTGNVYVAGQTNSTDFPTLNAAQATYGGGYDDGFVAKISNANPTPPCGATAAGILVALTGVIFILLQRRRRATKNASVTPESRCRETLRATDEARKPAPPVTTEIFCELEAMLRCYGSRKAGEPQSERPSMIDAAAPIC